LQRPASAYGLGNINDTMRLWPTLEWLQNTGVWNDFKLLILLRFIDCDAVLSCVRRSSKAWGLLMSFSSFRAASPSCSSAVAGPVGHRNPLLLSSLALVLLSSAAHAQNVELPTVRVETTAPSDQQGYV